MTDQTFDNLFVTQKLRISNDVSSPTNAQLYILVPNEAKGEIYLESKGNLFQLAVNSSIASIGTSTTLPLDLRTGDVSRIYISENGNVGIGSNFGFETSKDKPKFNLDIQGSINATQFNKNGKLWKITDDDIDGNTISGTKIKDGTISKEKLSFPITPSTNQWAGDSSIISYGGKVGIGTTTPNFDLDVQGTKGIINAKQFNKNGSPWIISRNEIASKAIDTDKIDDGAVSDIKIANNAVTRDKIADKSITKEKLAFDISPGGGSSQWQGADGGPISYIKGNVGIGTTNPKAKLQVDSGAIMPSFGNSETAGIMFPKDPGGGGGDAAWIRYYKREGEATTLEIGISNDQDDHIYLNPSGNVGINTKKPEAILHIVGPRERFSNPNIGGEIKLFTTSGLGDDFSYNGGADSVFGFTHYGNKNGDTKFQWQAPNGQLTELLRLINNGEVKVPGSLFVKGVQVQGSSRKQKKNITDLSTAEAIETLAGLNPVKFNYRTSEEKKPVVGFIAEDVPELVATSEREGVCALEIVAVLTKVIKEQQHELSLLKERVNSLETKSY